MLDPDFPGPVFGPYNEFRAAVRDSFESITLGDAEIEPTIDAVNSAFAEDLTSYADDVG